MEFMLEGTLRVYWGLKNEVNLKADDTLVYWKSFHPDDELNESNNEHLLKKGSMKVLFLFSTHMGSCTS